MDKKVSVITPCFNGEKFVERYLISILNQTYQNIELIFVNDGSTDNTENIVKKFIPKLKKKGIEMIYIYQENKGQAAALNKGLEFFSGDYLTWPDSDDILKNDSIEKKVSFLENYKEYGVVRTDAEIVLEDNLKDIVGYMAKNNPNRKKENIFEDLIIENKVWFAPGCYMVRREVFFDAIPQKCIYEARGGQNWQMLLPITYKYKCGYLDEPLYTYVIRGESHSHSVVELSELLKRCDEHENILNHTINKMNIENNAKRKYLAMVKEKYMLKRFNLAAKHSDIDLLTKYYSILKNENRLTKTEKNIYLVNKYKSLKKIAEILNVIRGGADLA